MPADVSLLLVMKNELRNMEKIFPIVQSQDYDGLVECVYVDSGSTDGTIEYMKGRGVEAHSIPPEEFHHGRTRNLAASLASNDILVVLSGDAVPANDQWLKRLVAPFGDERVGGVYGRQIAPQALGPLRRQSLNSLYPAIREVRDLAKGGRIHAGLFRFSNANAALRKQVWERFPWNEELLLAEDQGMCRDILMSGMKVVYEPGATVIHGHERTMLGEFKYAVDNGVSLSRLGILNNPEIGGEFRYGLTRVQAGIADFTRQGMYFYALASVGSNVVKWLGVQLGKREKRLPRWLFRHISEVHGKLPISDASKPRG